MKQATTPKAKTPRGRALEWDDDDLDRLSEIHVTEDTPLMLAFARQHGTPRLYALLTAAREEPPADALPVD